ncbi:MULTISPECIES: trimeric intracellular cation channel family protein [Shewanella]|uniref:Trimeric intracellular cation channel family protein n=1 Tax=Shewanella fidelis TaxID=173509 RepID=A0AAW8NPK0_9GAMM|nr:MULTISPECIES: trimeric intracellular cation channel family protein [Shewanella]MDR8524812.1 trimeric intracellular cation channel family protein [Shewanella fidelis]MDW4810883.1 trimeric intracellular cation channel family protein [Shewanella fidelis]MDW4815338.1 trimeric intracellular cation channel family protein [Shewanella fidelis]MDW4819428.1 trimeric intracellular cation channel family protein [Shewanella fidelis]MDW4822894.1 trimeric intracellular cation channel family protein [Shewa
MIDWIYFFDLCGTAVFALSGALAAGRHKMDPFGVLVLASVTAIGGGSIRDALLGTTPVFWIQDPNYIIVILATVILSFVFIRKPKRVPRYILPVADAFGLALFTVIGAEKALNLGLDGMTAVVMGLITGVGGGIIRDLLCQQVPMVLRTEIYATASIVGGISYTISLYWGAADMFALLFAMSTALMIRLAAIRWHLSLPAFDLKTPR